MKINISYDKYNEIIQLLIRAETIPDGISIGGLYSNYVDTINDPFDERIKIELDRNNHELDLSFKLEKPEKLETKNVGWCTRIWF